MGGVATLKWVKLTMHLLVDTRWRLYAEHPEFWIPLVCIVLRGRPPRGNDYPDLMLWCSYIRERVSSERCKRFVEFEYAVNQSHTSI